MIWQIEDLIEEQDAIDLKKLKKLMRDLQEDVQLHTEAMHRLAYAIESNNTKKPKRDNGI